MIERQTTKLRIAAYVHMFPPIHNAGSETTLLALLRGLVKRGHSAKVIASEIDHDYEVDGVQVLGARVPQEPFAREVFEWSDIAITHLNCTGPAMRAARDTRKPLVHLVHNDKQLQFHNVRPLRAQLVIFNSHWVRAASPMDPSMVIHPIIEKELYAVERGPEAVRTTFVNLTVTKGANVFYELSRRLPKIQFCGVEGAYGDQVIPQEQMHNVTILHHTPDIQQIYRTTKVILMPSDYESYGRIATEAACSGIPSIVHPTPGLTEALGKAGIYCDRDKIDDWQAELTRLYSDHGYYAERSAAALELANSWKPEQAFDRAEAALVTVAKAGLEGFAWTVDCLGEEEYIRRAIEGNYFDPKQEPASYRPALGDGPMRKKPFISDRKLCLDGQGRVVEANDPNRVQILCGPNASIPFERAQALGLFEKAVAGPEENKMITGPEEDKAVGGPPEAKGRSRRRSRGPQAQTQPAGTGDQGTQASV